MLTLTLPVAIESDRSTEFHVFCSIEKLKQMRDKKQQESERQKERRKKEKQLEETEERKRIKSKEKVQRAVTPSHTLIALLAI